MAFLDAFKRWRLARRGLSSGRKRRVFTENTVIAILERSVWVRWALFALFALGTAILVDLIGSEQKTGHSVLFGLVVASTAIMIVETNYEAICHRNGRVFLVLGGLAFHVGVVITISKLVDLNGLPSQWKFLMIPFALTPMVHAVLLGRGIGIFSTIYAALLGALVMGRGDVLVYMSVCLVCGLITVLTVHQVRKRVQLLRAGVYAGAAALFLAIAFGEIDLITCFQSGFSNCRETLVSCALALLTGIVTALLVSGLLPVLESMFQLTTDISWLEHGDLNHKLLRRLQLEAPGTFHHSLIVASLAEAAAEKVGANAPMCRVCAYFHDIGKLAKPEYFIENQHPGAENPHDSLTPTMSALIIIAHVKDGIDLAVKHKLNPKVIEVIQEHHGDSLVSFFYRRAQEQKKAELEKVEKGLGNPEDLPKIDEKNFRYPGPRPRSRESGILSLADAVESASRTLKKPTPAKIRSLVEDIVEARICDGQLDDCQLTICDLKHVQESFSNTLRSMMHSRIDYPKEEGAKRLAHPNHEGVITSAAPTKSAAVQPPAPIAATASHHPA